MPPTDPPLANPMSRANRWLVWTFTAAVACTVLLFAAFVVRGDSPKRALNRTVLSVIPPLYASEYSEDSWGPMGRAFLRSQTREDGDIYGIFFDEGKKFQYPPTSLLIFFVLPDSWLGPENFIISEDYTTLKGPTRFCLRTASQLAILITIAASVAIMELGIRRLRGPGKDCSPWRYVRIGIGTYLGLTFYPVIWAHGLGQIQVFLNALTALGILAHLLGWQVRSGICLGICCLVKPQYAILLIWAILRRNWKFLTGFSVAVFPLGLVSLALFGWDNHMRYIEVIREIARVGESFWANQSVNGFVNRLIGNGDPINFSPVAFAPYHPLVHSITIATSLLIIGLALFRRKAATEGDSTLDLAVIIAAATMASPIAWEHHYGAFLPLFALALPACLRLSPGARIPGLLLGASYLAISIAVIAPDAFFSPRSRGWTASHLFFGAILFFGLLIYLRRMSRVGATAGSPEKEAATSLQSIAT